MMLDENEQRRIRIDKLNALRERGIDPFAIERYDRTHTAAQVHEGLEQLSGAKVTLAGRVFSIRKMGKALFSDIEDETGRIQLHVRRDLLGDAYADFKSLDIADIVGVEGEVFRTEMGEDTVRVTGFTLLAKAVRHVPLGKKRDGVAHETLKDDEARQRMRYVDLLANPESRDALIMRCRVVQAVREFLNARGFLEVETPVLQSVAGGASARPFMTFHNDLKLDLKLRISLELYLKRLIVGGIPKVYEIGRVFRNEAADTDHNPEFTLMELYEAYTDLEGMMDLVEDMYVDVARRVIGTTVVHPVMKVGDEALEAVTVDLSQRPWRRLPMMQGILENSGLDRSAFRDMASAREAARSIGLDPEKMPTVGKIIEKVHEKVTQPKLVQPTFVVDYPIETSPLAKKHPNDPTLTRRFEVFIAGQELGNAFSEINDPFDQRERFADQLLQMKAGEQEAHPMDEDFIRALECGMPPTGGLGVGMDRLAMVLAGARSIRDVLLFPLLRPE